MSLGTCVLGVVWGDHDKHLAVAKGKAGSRGRDEGELIFACGVRSWVSGARSDGTGVENKHLAFRGDGRYVEGLRGNSKE